MPEGDTVYHASRVLERALVGSTLTASDFRVPQLATVDLAGWRVDASLSRGKHLLLRVAEQDGDRRLTLRSHLRMDGAWRTYATGQRWERRPVHLIRVVLRTAEIAAVGYHLHDLALVPTAKEDTLVGHLGPDLLGPDWDAAEATRRIAAHPAEPIAEAILDQTNLAGIGNVYKSEILYLRGIAPWTPVRNVRELPALVMLAHRLLVANRDRPVRTTTGSLRRGETSHVYGRRGDPCRRCGTRIAKAEQGDRVTYWCPACQPGPSPA